MSESIESKIKNLREAANLSISELAEAASVTTQQMEQIESGEAHPTLSTLMKIARFMGVRLGTLLDGAESAGPVVNSSTDNQPTVRIAGSTQKNDHLNFFSLAENKSDRNMEPMIVEVDFRANDQERSQHEGEEFIYVLEGGVKIVYGTQEYTLGKGDSIYYDSIVPHLVSSDADGSTSKVLAVTYTPY